MKEKQSNFTELKGLVGTFNMIENQNMSDTGNTKHDGTI